MGFDLSAWTGQLQQINTGVARDEQKPDAYISLLNQLPTVSLGDEEFRTAYLSWLDCVLRDSILVQTKKKLFDTWAKPLQDATPEESITVSNALLDMFAAVSQETTISPTQLALIKAALAEMEPAVRDILATAYEETEHYVEAARVLERIATDRWNDTDKAKLYIRIVRNYIEESDLVSADVMMNRIRNLSPDAIDKSTTEGRILKIHFDLSQAKILDSKRKFLEASNEYLMVSFSSVVAEEDRLQSLSAAVICAILAPAGPARSAMLSRLYKDDRAVQLTSIYDMLEKIFLDRILSPEELQAFSAKLAPHQLAMTKDGSTVLDRAVIEHNLLAASRIYSNVHVNDLGTSILNLKDDAKGTAGEKAEMYASRMLEQGRMVGCIDQIDGVLYFDTPKGQMLNESDRRAKVRDAAIQNIAQDVERVGASIIEQYPELARVQTLQ
ncbi:COP9 signalosome subunit CsnD [Ascosphaera apis ARSEF 7405]|uniref:COP9 signalosome complex subunit 4 n=1 Tax=Ascosphaera apis ARSEF 7405 TaxID=392613 RepID=A0A162I8L8_9EURO|nr:COP9 signalosome subunit CsnD [Ascosphaera apis ARSEF 7405]